MRFSRVMMTLLSVCILAATTAAQDDIEDMYLRKAVKDFVARDYDATVGDLEQVLTVNPQNAKARKLLGKVYARKGEQALAQNNITEAVDYYNKSSENDPGNADAAKGLSDVKQRQASQQAAAQERRAAAAEAAQASQPQGQMMQQPYAVPPPTIIQTTTQSSASDSAQAKIIENLLSSFNQNQKIIAQQIEQTSALTRNNDNSKDKYLDALLGATKESNDRMMRYILIGGGVAAVFLIIFVAVFFLFFHSVNKSAELRTIQATQNMASLLLAAPQAAGGGATPLLLTGPSGPPADRQAAEPVSGQPIPQSAPGGAAQKADAADIELLNNDDPIKRAQAVEAVEAEIIESKDSVRIEKIKKLGDLLKDENNRVRANAAKAIYEVDKEASLKCLSGMLKDSSKRMRASAIWALGEIGSEESLELLFGIDKETDEMITYNIKMALEKIKNGKRFPITVQQLERIESEVEKYKEMV
jgi:tetratricopeptide (TPR) repeat protein